MNVEDSLLIFNNLNLSDPNTNEMNVIFSQIKNCLESQNELSECIFINIDAMAGSGKSTLAKKIYHYCRSLNKICLGACATALAVQVYNDMEFDTLHGLFSIPVIEDEEDYDNINRIYCDLNRNKQKVELIFATSLFIFDEFFSNHKYCLNAIMKSYNNLLGKLYYSNKLLFIFNYYVLL